MDFNLTGATRLYIIVGDPIAQVKAPSGVTAAFAARDRDAVLVPVRVAPRDLKDLLEVADRIPNLDGIVVTVPHKFACYEHCTSATDRCNFLQSANLMRRRADGGWHGEMVDGVGFVGAVRGGGGLTEGRRALLVGAGGAGSAIALGLVDAGVSELAIHDEDAARRDRLIGRLAAKDMARIRIGSADPTGFDIIANATPAGMREGDPYPVEVEKLTPDMFVGCVITKPAVSPIIAAARAKGCKTSTGTDMYNALQNVMVDFLLAGERLD